MKLKTFFAHNIQDALKDVHSQFSDNAIIVSTSRVPNKGIKLIVAVKERLSDTELSKTQENEKLEDRITYFNTLLKHNNFDSSFIKRLSLASIKKASKTPDEKLLSHALSEVYSFKPIYPTPQSPIYIFIGNAGSGKTLSLKKMALQAKKENLNPGIVTLDNEKSGALEDLKNFSKMLQIPFTAVKTIKDRPGVVQTAETPGFFRGNPTKLVTGLLQ